MKPFVEIAFVLVLTPPKQILDRDVTLIESNCVPSALLHFGCDAMSDNHLKPELFEKLSSGSGASRLLLSTNGYQDEAANENEGAGPSSHNPKKAQVTNNFMTSKASAAPSGLPKWFQPRK